MNRLRGVPGLVVGLVVLVLAIAIGVWLTSGSTTAPPGDASTEQELREERQERLDEEREERREEREELREERQELREERIERSGETSARP